MVYYLTFEVFARLFSLDLQWIVNFILNNIFWVFAFLVLTWFFFDGKNLLLGTVLLAVNCWAAIDIAAATGWVILGTGFLLLYYITRLALIAWVENDAELNKHMLVFINIQFFGLWIIYNLFIR